MSYINQVITATEAKSILGVNERYIRKICTAGKIQARQTGTVWLIWLPSLIELAAGRIGTVSVDGDKYILNEQPAIVNQSAAAPGQPYQVQFAADAIDEQGNLFTVYWAKEFIRGNEPDDLSSLDWSAADSVEARV